MVKQEIAEASAKYLDELIKIVTPPPKAEPYDLPAGLDPETLHEKAGLVREAAASGDEDAITLVLEDVGAFVVSIDTAGATRTEKAVLKRKAGDKPEVPEKPSFGDKPGPGTTKDKDKDDDDKPKHGSHSLR